MKEIKPNFIDSAIRFISPKAYAERMAFRYKEKLMQDSVRRYEGAAHSRRTTGWIAPATSATSEIHQALAFLRNRSRDLSRNNPYAENAVREIANNMVGTGIMPKALGLPKTIEKRLKANFKAWAESTDCDYDGHMNFYGLQQLVARTVVESGECIVRRHIINDKNLDMPMQLQVLEPDFIDTTKYEVKQADGGYIYYGVEFNGKNKIVAYWLWESHPGDNIQYNIQSNRIPADEIIHVFEKKRPGQFRGVPFGHPSMLKLKDLDDYEDAQLIRQKIAACFTVFITNDEGVLQNTGSAAPLEKVEPGIIEYLPAGKTVSFANPPDAGQNYDSYVKSVLRGAASGYGMDYVTLTGDLTAVNFSSGRMGWLKFHRNVAAWQWLMLVPQLCNKTWAWYIQVANIMGIIKQLKVPVSWTPPRREMIDPVKEVEGMEKQVQMGLTSMPDIIRQNGDDPEETLDEIIDWNKKTDAAGLKLSSDARYDPKRKMDNGEAQTQNPPPVNKK